MATPVLGYGLGPIGARLARRVLQRRDLGLVAGVDIDPAKAGQDLGRAIGLEEEIGVRVTAELGAPPAESPRVALHCTSSRLAVAAPQIEKLAGLGWNVISTCEELALAAALDPAPAARLDAAARAAGVTILGSGINPGFVLDTLPLVLSGACVRVDSVFCRRIVDTNQRRIPLQKKAGVGMTEAAFRELAARRAVGHVGLEISARILAAGLGWELSDYEETIEPVLAREDVETGLGVVPRGGVIGQHQEAVGRVDGRAVIRYELEMVAGAQPVDEIQIEGQPPLHQRIEGGINGDIGTEAVICNLIRPVLAAPPGLITMRDLVPLACAQEGGE